MFLEKVEKATCDMVTVIVSVKIRRWTALKEDTIQPFKPDSSFIIVIIIINIIIISFMQGIYTYIPETNCVPREYSVAAILLLLFMVLISLVSVLNLLYFYISTFRSMCTVSNMAVFVEFLDFMFIIIIIIVIIITIVVVVVVVTHIAEQLLFRTFSPFAQA